MMQQNIYKFNIYVRKHRERESERELADPIVKLSFCWNYSSNSYTGCLGIV